MSHSWCCPTRCNAYTFALPSSQTLVSLVFEPVFEPVFDWYRSSWAAATLTELDLAQCENVTSVMALRNCSSLRKLKLYCTAVTDAGISMIGHLRQLEELVLSDTFITSVAPLKECKSLLTCTYPPRQSQTLGMLSWHCSS